MVPGWQAGLLRAWCRRGVLACLLWPLSCLFRLLVGLRMGLYRRGWLAAQALPVPVIVVGNVMIGGVGKTPVVMALVQHLQDQGLAVGVIARGYGRQRQDGLEVLPDSLAADVGDEALLIRQRTGAPVFVAARRVDAAQALLAAWPGTQIIVSDDGLQHLALQRDAEICVFDDRGTGNGLLLPAGPLREPWPRRPPHTPAPAQWVLHTGNHPAFAGYRVRRRLADHAVRADGTRVALRQLVDHPAAPLQALAGIAQPAIFFQQLRAQGLLLAQTQALPDHFDFAHFARPLDPQVQRICTEKDAVKLWAIDPEALAVPLVVALDAIWLAELDTWVLARLSSGAPTPLAPAATAAA